jgi:putrescine aminotransferase
MKYDISQDAAVIFAGIDASRRGAFWPAPAAFPASGKKHPMSALPAADSPSADSPFSWTAEEKAALRRDALQYIIPHYGNHRTLAQGAKIYVRGEGCYVYDVDGKRYFDSFATLLTTVCGHHRPEITAAVQRQMDLLEFFPNYEDAFTVPMVELARKLAQLLPGDLAVSFFVNSGSEANETAIKMARQYHAQRGARQRYKFIARQGSYHATTLGGGSLTGIPWFREYFEPLLPGAIFAPAARDHERPQDMTSREYGQQCLARLEELIQFERPETIAGMIMDPLPGSNTGYPLPPEGYLAGVRALCDKYGLVLIFDEVQSGFGKTGKWFFCEHDGVVPDIMTIAKGLTGGFIPLGAAVTTPKIADTFRQGPGSEFRSGSTYGGHTVACAATLANIAILERENLVANAAAMGELIRAKLVGLRQQCPIVGDVRGIGLLWAAVLKTDPQLGVGDWIRAWCYQHGMILRNNGNVLVLAPSLIITAEEVQQMIDLIGQAIAAASREFRL